MRSILIVDDDANLCSVLREELSMFSYKVHVVNCADAACEFLAAGNEVDLIEIS